MKQHRIVDHPTVQAARMQQMVQVTGDDLGHLLMELRETRNRCLTGAARAQKYMEYVSHKIDEIERR